MILFLFALDRLDLRASLGELALVSEVASTGASTVGDRASTGVPPGDRRLEGAWWWIWLLIYDIPSCVLGIVDRVLELEKPS